MSKETPTMGDAPRLTDEAVAAILREFKPLSAEAMMAKEIIERRAQSEGAQAKVVEAARRLLAAGPRENMSRVDVSIVCRAVLTPPRQTEEKTHE